MYGLEKGAKDKFSFDLEIEMHKSPKRAKEILDKVEKKMHDIKTLLRQGEKSEDFDKYGVLLHGYSACQKVLKKVAKS